MRAPHAERPAAGFTLLELSIAVAIAVVLAAVGVPSYADLVARHRLQGVVENLRADIALARREASARALPVHIAFMPGNDWCYALGTGTATNCRRAGTSRASGAAPGQIKQVHGQDHPGVRLLQAQTMLVDGRNGGQPGGQTWARFGLADGRQLQVRLGPLGHSSICAPATPIAGVSPCPDSTSPP